MICPHCGNDVPVPDGPETSDDFLVFWAAYPKHKARADAEKAWRQTQKCRPPLCDLLGALRVQSSSPEWLKEGGTFIPLPASWLRGRRWEDDTRAQPAPVAGGYRPTNAWVCDHKPMCRRVADCINLTKQELREHA